VSRDGRLRIALAALAYAIVLAGIAAGWAALDGTRWDVPAAALIGLTSLAWGWASGLAAIAGPLIAAAGWAAMLSADGLGLDGLGFWFALVGCLIALTGSVAGALGRAWVALAPEEAPSPPAG
jgi:hypothetical protein